MDKRIILYVVLGFLVLGILLATFFPGLIYVMKDSVITVEDKCTPTTGYTEESWREYMEHHPNLYKECLT